MCVWWWLCVCVCEREASAAARHAEIWRAIRATVARQARPPPQFDWTPSHKTPEEVIGRGVGVRSWLGNAWADFFATVALHEVTLSPNFGKGLQGRIAEAVSRASFVAGAGKKVLSSGKWSATEEEPRAPKPPPKGPSLSLGAHDLAPELGGFRCRKCNRAAHTEETIRGLWSRPCRPSHVSRARARALFAKSCTQELPEVSPASQAGKPAFSLGLVAAAACAASGWRGDHPAAEGPAEAQGREREGSRSPRRGLSQALEASSEAESAHMEVGGVPSGAERGRSEERRSALVARLLAAAMGAPASCEEQEDEELGGDARLPRREGEGGGGDRAGRSRERTDPPPPPPPPLAAPGAALAGAALQLQGKDARGEEGMEQEGDGHVLTLRPPFTLCVRCGAYAMKQGR